IIFIIHLNAGSVFAKTDKLSVRWEGKLISPQGERSASAMFKKESGNYTGTITGQRDDLQLKDIKVDGDKITAKAEIETPQGNIQINYSFLLQGDSLKGTGSLDFGGTPYSFDIDLKRAVEGSTTGQQGPPPPPAQPPRQRMNVPQPQQKQSIDYFVGQWTFK